MTTPAKKIPAKKSVRSKTETAPTITATPTGLMAIMRHMSKDHRLMKHEVQHNMGMVNNPEFDRLWTEARL